MEQNLNYRKLYPIINKNFIDIDLEKKMSIIKKIVSLIHALRKNNKIKVRQPLQEIILYSYKNIDYLLPFKEIILKETNVKELKIIYDSSLILKFIVKPNFKKLGNKYKTKMKEIICDIKNLTPIEIKNLNNGTDILLKCGIHISKNDCLFDVVPLEDIRIEKYGDFIIGLNTKISLDLEEEGILRDFISLIQNYRKKNNFNIYDKIKVNLYITNTTIYDSIKKFAEEINELLTSEIIFCLQYDSNFEKLKLFDEDIFVKITKV